MNLPVFSDARSIKNGSLFQKAINEFPSWKFQKNNILFYCVVLYCVVLYCIVLYCIVLYCIVLYCIVLYCIVLYCIVLYCILTQAYIATQINKSPLTTVDNTRHTYWHKQAKLMLLRISSLSNNANNYNKCHELKNKPDHE